MGALDLSISIVSYNDRDFMNDFLRSIYQNIKDISFEVLVVNNGSQDGVVEMIKEEYPQVDLIVNEKNMFFTYATNQNLSRARGEFIAYLSSDTLVSERSFSPMITMMRRDPRIGVMGPVIYDFQGHIYSPGQRFPSVCNSILELIGFHKRFPMNRIWVRRHYRDRDSFKTFNVDSVSGACLMTKQDVLEKVGLLDEKLVMFYDEHDFCRRVREYGWQVTHCGEAEIWHYGHGTCRKQSSVLISQLMQNSALHLYRKYYSYPGYLLVRLVMSIVQTAYRLYRGFVPVSKNTTSPIED